MQPSSTVGQDESNHRISLDFAVKIGELEPKNYGQVLIYENNSNQKITAVKTFYQSESNNNEIKEQFIASIQKMKLFEHCNIIPILDYTVPSQTQQPQISYEYMYQGSLEELMKERSKGIPNILSNKASVAKIIEGIILGMIYLHSNGIDHLDLKPSNILINDQGEAMITDYWNEVLIKTGATISMPIEVQRYKNPNETNINDRYSFCVILYELLNEIPLYPEDIVQEQLNLQHLTRRELNFSDEVHPKIREIITNGLKSESSGQNSFHKILADLIEINFIQSTVDPSMNISIRLMDGSLYPMKVKYSNSLYSIREKISQYIRIPINEIALSENYNRPLCCCWNCTYGKEAKIKDIFQWIDNKKNPTINLLVKIKAVAKDYPKIKIKSYLKPYSGYPDIPADSNETYFYMVPGTVADMINEITSDFHNTFYLKGCSFKVGFQGQILQPSEIMYDVGIRFNSEIDIIMDWPSRITINGKKIMCNLKDPISELFWRFFAEGIPYARFPVLRKGEEVFPFGCEKTLEEAGIVDGDKLICSLLTTEHFFKYDLYENGNLYYELNEDIKYVKMNYILYTQVWCPIGYMRINRNYSLMPYNKGTIAELNLSNLNVLKIGRLTLNYMMGDIEY